MRFWRNRFLKGQTTSDETVLKIFITKQILLHNFALPVFFFDRTFFHILFFHAYFLKHFGWFGRFCWCDFGRTDFWRVKRRQNGQMRLSWKFSLLNRYFSTTLLYQFFSTRQYVTSSYWLNLADLGGFCWCDFGRIDFWRVKRRQMRLSGKFSLLNRYFSTTLLYQFFFRPDNMPHHH